MGANRRLVSIIVAVTVLFAAIDVVWLPFSTISLDPRNFGHLAKAASAALAAYLIGRLVLYRLRDERSWAAGAMRWAADRLIVLVAVSTIFLPLGFVSAIFMYLASATQVPLVDGKLAALDAALGFDWRSFLETTNGSPPVAWALVIAYHSLTPQVIALFLLYSAARRANKALEFVALLAVSSVFTGLLMAMFPAAGAYAYFDPPPETFDAFTAQAGMWRTAEAEVGGQLQPVCCERARPCDFPLLPHGPWNHGSIFPAQRSLGRRPDRCFERSDDHRYAARGWASFE